LRGAAGRLTSVGVHVVSPEEVPDADRGMAVTIGAYDGVHIGHRRILALLRERADALGVPAAVVTFDRHPATVIRPASAPKLLTGPDQKLELLAECGVDITVIVRFDARRAQESAEEFVEEVLLGALGAKAVVVGEDFHFGHARLGNVALLRDLGAVSGFDVAGVPLSGVRQDGDPGVVSSTRIRGLVAAGDVRDAAALLARPHEVRGPVVHGDGRGGALLGMPTANVAVGDGIAVPAVGIYAGWCRRADGSLHPAAVSVGLRPTFAEARGGADASPLVEAHLLDFDGDLYTEPVGVLFVERLRDERRFDRVEDLVAQMWDDVRRARSLLAEPQG
jgi:riboflavin kinase/FMN adenylyltransferase